MGQDIRGVHLASCCKHAVGVCDDGDKAGFKRGGGQRRLQMGR